MQSLHRSLPAGRRSLTTSKRFSTSACRCVPIPSKSALPVACNQLSSLPPAPRSCRCFHTSTSSPAPLRSVIARASAASADGFYPDQAADAAAAQTTATSGNSSFGEAVLNVCNILMGVGLLSIPFALRQAGWAGLGFLVLMAFVTNYTGKALVQCHAAVAARSAPGTKIGYEEIAEAAFGPVGRLFISSVIYMELFGCCCLLMILEGDNLFALLGGALASSSTGYMVLGALLMIPTLWLPDLKALSYLGIFGITATCTVAATVAYTLISGSFTAGAATTLINPATLPLVFGILAFVYSGHGVFPSIQASMKEPKQFPKVLDTAYLIVATVCTFIGAAGYYMYGSGAADIITFNLPAGVLAQFCACLILINPIAKFAITLEPVANALQRAVGSGNVARLASRTVLGLTCLVAARYVPFLAYLMSLVGSFLTIGVSVIFPALCHLKLHKGQLHPAYKALNMAVIALGVVCAVSGTTAAVQSLAAKAAAAAAGMP